MLLRYFVTRGFSFGLDTRLIVFCMRTIFGTLVLRVDGFCFGLDIGLLVVRLRAIFGALIFCVGGFCFGLLSGLDVALSIYYYSFLF